MSTEYLFNIGDTVTTTLGGIVGLKFQEAKVITRFEGYFGQILYIIKSTRSGDAIYVEESNLRHVNFKSFAYTLSLDVYV